MESNSEGQDKTTEFILKNIEELKKCEASILPLVDTSINVNNQHIFLISWNIIDFYLIKFKGRG